MSASGGTGESKPQRSFQTNIRYAIHYIIKVINGNESADLDNLDKHIKDLKLNLEYVESKALGSRFAAEIAFAQKVLQLDEDTRVLKTEQMFYENGLKAMEHAATILVDASERSRSKSPFTPPLTLTAKNEIIRKLSSPTPFITEAGVTARTPSPRPPSVASPRISDFGGSQRSMSPYPMQPPIEDSIRLNDNAHTLKIEVEQYYHKMEQELEAKQAKKAQPVVSRPNKPKG